MFALGCFASIGGVLFGYDQGVISGVLVMNNFGNIMFDDGTGMLPGVGNVLQGTTSSATALKWGKPGVVL